MSVPALLLSICLSVVSRSGSVVALWTVIGALVVRQLLRQSAHAPPMGSVRDVTEVLRELGAAVGVENGHAGWFCGEGGRSLGSPPALPMEAHQVE